jgi:DNA repair protein RadA/Sms
VCQQCNYESPQWYGKCPSCGSWNSFVETVKDYGKQSARTNTGSVRQKTVPQKLSEVKHIDVERTKTGIGEFDRVIGGGVVPGSVTLLAGDPGIGKSTLLLHVVSSVGGVYVAGEESAEQVKLRAKRLGIGGENITILAETYVEAILETLSSMVETKKVTKNKDISSIPLVIIDSIQTLSSGDLDGMAGSVGQIRYSAEKMVAFAKSKGVPFIFIGHVTKEGTIAGPKILEHMVDAVLYVEGERFASARILRTFKNRFGAVEEVGIFDMEEKGLKEIQNPSALFLQDRVEHVPGSIVTVLMEGTRPLLVEVQGLVVPSQLAVSRRVANGFDYNRLQLLTAIIQKRLNMPLGTYDIFVNVSGGLKIQEPAADLAIALAIISSFKNKAIDPHTAVFGEVGLLGELRATVSEERRIKESIRLGYKHVLTPKTVKTLKKASEILT